MPTMTFRFTTEVEMQLRGDSYEDIYLQFKDFMHGDKTRVSHSTMNVFPPETVQVFFDIENSGALHEIPEFKGNFNEDIKGHCEAGDLNMSATPYPSRVINCFQEDWSVFWH